MTLSINVLPQEQKCRSGQDICHMTGVTSSENVIGLSLCVIIIFTIVIPSIKGLHIGFTHAP